MRSALTIGDLSRTALVLAASPALKLCFVDRDGASRLPVLKIIEKFHFVVILE
jgi:hypothetical protein